MTDRSLLIQTQSLLLEVMFVLQKNKTFTHDDVIGLRDKTLAALSHLQGLENRFRQGLIDAATNSTRETKGATYGDSPPEKDTNPSR